MTVNTIEVEVTRTESAVGRQYVVEKLLKETQVWKVELSKNVRIEFNSRSNNA